MPTLTNSSKVIFSTKVIKGKSADDGTGKSYTGKINKLIHKSEVHNLPGGEVIRNWGAARPQNVVACSCSKSRLIQFCVCFASFLFFHFYALNGSVREFNVKKVVLSPCTVDIYWNINGMEFAALFSFR